MSETPKKKEDSQDPFGEVLRSMNQWFGEKPVRNLMQSMDGLFDGSPFSSTAFSVNTRETNEAQWIEAKLPGIKKENIGVEVFTNHVSISVTEEEETTVHDEKSKRTESKKSKREQTRTIPFSPNTDPQNMKANYKDGLLTIRVPKKRGKRLSIE